MIYKLLPSISILMLLTNYGFAQSNINDLDKLKLNGKVKTLKETALIYPALYDEFNQQISGNNYDYIRFSKDGYMLERRNRNSSVKTIFDYYEGGNRLKSKKVNYPEYYHWFTYTYDENGNLLMETKNLSDGVMLEGTGYKYDRKSNLIRKQNYRESGQLATWVGYRYDEKGNITELTKYHEESELTVYWVTKFAYNLTGKVISETDSIPYDSNLSRTTYNYDEQGKLIEKKEFSRNDKKALTHSRTYSYKYDAKGNLIEENTFSHDVKNISNKVYAFKYDRKNNWVKWTEYKANKPIRVYKRKITYYK